MREIKLDGKEMRGKEEVHLYLKNKLALRGYYGNNLDALWDALSTVSEPLRIELIHGDELIQQLGDYGEEIVNVFEEAAEVSRQIEWIVSD